MATSMKKFEESFFKEVFHAASIGMALVSPEGKWLQVNEALTQMVGYSEEELLKTSFQKITHPDDLEKDLEYVKEMLEGRRKQYYMEKRYFHKDGHIVHVGLSVSLVRNSEGDPLFFVSQIQDLTKEKNNILKLLQAKDQQQRILSAMNSGVYIYNLNEKKNTYINEEYTKITGWSIEEINEMGETFMELFHPDEHSRIVEHMGEVVQLESGNTSEITYRFKKKNGEWIWLTSHDGGFNYDKDGNMQSFIGSFIDVTQRIEYEQKRESEIKELELMNRTMLTRELRMKELKNEVDKLRKELGLNQKYS